MDMSFLFDPQFWIVQLILVLIAGFFRAIPDILLWHFGREMRRYAQDMSDEEADRFWAEHDKNVEGVPPGRWLQLIVTYSFIRKARRSRRAAQTEVDVKAASPSMPATAGKKARRARPPLSSRLATAFSAIGGAVVGGPEGADYERAWMAELAEVKNPAVKMAHALSNILGAFRIRVTTKAIPRLWRLAATPARIIGTALDTIASSEMLSYAVIGGPLLIALVLSGYVIGKMPLAFSTAIAGIPVISGGIELWRRRRIRKRRQASAGGKE